MKPSPGLNVDWCKVIGVLRLASDADILACAPKDHSAAGANGLQTICLFNEGPKYNGPQKEAFTEAAAVIVRVYKAYHALNWRSGRKDDTAMAKACASGNEYMVKLLIEAGASAHPLGYSNLIPRPSVCFQEN